MTEGYLWDHGTEQERYATSREFDEIQEDIYQEFVKDNGAIQYSHKVSVGEVSGDWSATHWRHDL